MDAKGVRAPDLTAIAWSEASEQRIGQIIRRGIAGTEMPRFGDSLSPTDMSALLGYLHTLNTPVSADSKSGDTVKGATVFATRCASCHQVHGEGGRLGPDLSRIAAARSRQGLIQKIRKAASYIAPQYSAVTIVTSDGDRIRGVKKNEDNFSIQIMDTRERLLGFDKSKLKEIRQDSRSLMPDFGVEALDSATLDDLLRYLTDARERPGNVR